MYQPSQLLTKLFLMYAKKIKNVIDLDTNIQIRMDFINPESADKFIEKGWDEEKQMYYYLVYFNKDKRVHKNNLIKNKNGI